MGNDVVQVWLCVCALCLSCLDPFFFWWENVDMELCYDLSYELLIESSRRGRPTHSEVVQHNGLELVLE